MELSSNLARLRHAGVRVAAITPDPPEIVARAAAELGLGFPLLSDPGGTVIDRFGLRNHNIVPNARQAPGIPFPGQYLLDPRGVVVAKSFTGDLRHRASATALVAEHFDRYEGRSITITTDEVCATITASTDRLHGGQEASFRVELDIVDGWHVYAAEVAAPYRPLAVALDVGGDLLATQSVQWPAATAVHVDATNETLPVHAGRVIGTGRYRLRWSPPPSIFGGLEEAVRTRAIAPGPHQMSCELRFQVCRDDVCLEPRSIPFTLELEVAPTAVPAPPRPLPPQPT